MINKSISVFLTLGIIFLISCEKETFYHYYIDNKSSSVITINGSDIIHALNIVQTINPAEKRNITNWSKRTKTTTLLEPTSVFGQDMLITNASGDTLTKNYRILSNWVSDIKNERATATHNYVLIISDSDF